MWSKYTVAPSAPETPPPIAERTGASFRESQAPLATARHLSAGHRSLATLVRLSTPQRIAATGAVSGIVLLFGLVTYDGLQRTHALRQSIDHTHRTLEAAGAILQDLTDAETGVRGYLVSDDEDFLQPYLEALGRISFDLSTLRRREMQTPMDTAQLDSLSRLVGSATGGLAATIAQRLSAGALVAIERPEMMHDKRNMDDIRELLRRIANRKRVQLESVTAEADAHERAETRTVVAGTLIIVILALLINYVLTGFADRQSVAAKRMVAKNQALEGANAEIAARADVEQDLLTTRLALATSIAKVGVWEWYMDTNTISWDDTMFEIYGMAPAKSIPYAQWSDALHADDLPAVEARLQRVIAHGQEGSAEFRMTRPDGSERIISAIERLIVTSADDVRLVGVNIDITDRRRVEHELAQGRRDELRFKDEFLSHVSHELRSPLTAIKQFTTILIGGLAGELNTLQTEYQGIVLKNVRQLQAMIDDLLEVTRLESGKLTVELESVAVAELLVDTFDTLRNSAREKGVTLACNVPPLLSLAHADPTRLRQILINLLDNAIKFTPAGGSAGVNVKNWPGHPGFLLFEVIDTGTGIDTELNERLFERLFQQTQSAHTSRKGLGLGLYICKELVTRQGGLIWVERNPTVGSTISFTIPIFSFDRIIAPLLVNNEWPSESTALVMIETSLPRAWRSREAQDEWVREARDSIQHCLISDLDAFLPTLRPSARDERFFVAAFTDQKGATVLTKRLRGHFERSPNLKQPNQHIEVSYHMMTQPLRVGGESTTEIIAGMAATLELAVKSYINPVEV